MTTASGRPAPGPGPEAHGKPIAGGSITLNGQDLTALSDEQMQNICGNEIGPSSTEVWLLEALEGGG
jgi:hypothetical protein